MTEEITVHQDTTINTTRIGIVLSVSGVVSIALAFMLVGRYAERLDRLEKDMGLRATISEMSELRRAVDEMKSGQIDLRTDIRSVRDLLIARQSSRGAP